MDVKIARAGEAPAAAARRTVFVDGHVHLYPEVRLDAALAALARHSGPAASGGAAPPTEAAAVLADPRGIDGFGRLLRAADSAELPAGWSVQDTGDRHVELRHADSGRGVLFIRGRQLVTKEGLEVLAAAVNGDVPDGAALGCT
ncbi:MAG: hypothetical protein JXB36_03680, partial [Gammaproteobacteria bacterium]|nr:hypothetical protein [Gammaproteobacteria bacterium]